MKINIKKKYKYINITSFLINQSINQSIILHRIKIKLNAVLKLSIF